MHRFFVEDLEYSHVNITGQDCAHVRRVLRSAVGDKLVLCDGRGSEAICEIIDITDSVIICAVGDVIPSQSEASCKVTLYMALCKGSKIGDIIDKSTQLGVTDIVLFSSRFCTAKPDPKSDLKKNVRYNKIALEAAKQSGRGIVPKVQLPLSYNEMLKATIKHDSCLLFYEKATDPLTANLVAGTKDIGVIIGSEGGFDTDEVDKAIKSGCHSLSLGPRILRCETAPTVALGILMNLTGNI